VIVDASSELGEAAPYCVAVAKGDPKGLLPGINEAIAKMLEEKVMDGFVEAANAIKDAGEAIEVSVDAPEG
jgi:polar amino acid transport system substrate-binding protein